MSHGAEKKNQGSTLDLNSSPLACISNALPTPPIKCMAPPNETKYQVLLSLVSLQQQELWLPKQCMGIASIQMRASQSC
jgi:hypothetical protein